MAKHQLTFDEYDAFCKATRRKLPKDENWGRSSRPVIYVNWFNAVQYCNWCSQKEGFQEVYQINQKQVSANWQANGYRLPTEAEWEYAARGGKQSRGFEFSGSNNADEVAWRAKNSEGKTQPVGLKKANELGIYDMSGNVWEWCWDGIGKKRPSAGIDPKGAATGTRRVLRGGSWSDVEGILVDFLAGSYPGPKNCFIGFRLAMTAVGL
ncbi:formylglycine-generating enzyme family protein [Haliscomenobacter hydrossis]|uniref:Sulphatase-modifying factor protein n=1 Tax=Haliscomenobacter hydrossis (strain ATCC 27775 / DSM 1100 / LMG 10767 / O) TaxID=760192 RepID=F4L4E7_HALH1|nr:SUMF1/EgtB/PvdO family nonheme iron enzyme [Haliscomenobacter hydrossis]AEE51816.1 Sulphatase-modifying factor protein [Haliscomenobacter hydrossis DSM 1100]